MHPEDIKASLRKARVRQSVLARKLKVTEAALYLVIHGQSKSQRIAQAISTAIGKRASELWPGKYPKLEKLQVYEAAGGKFPELPGERRAITTAAPNSETTKAPSSESVPRRPAAKRA